MNQQIRVMCKWNSEGHEKEHGYVQQAQGSRFSKNKLMLDICNNSFCRGSHLMDDPLLVSAEDRHLMDDPLLVFAGGSTSDGRSTPRGSLNHSGEKKWKLGAHLWWDIRLLAYSRSRNSLMFDPKLNTKQVREINWTIIESWRYYNYYLKNTLNITKVFEHSINHKIPLWLKNNQWMQNLQQIKVSYMGLLRVKK